jgi:hypothetical protein
LLAIAVPAKGFFFACCAALLRPKSKTQAQQAESCQEHDLESS